MATPYATEHAARVVRRSAREACMALGCIALKARQGLALRRTSIVGQRLRCCRVAELENSPKAGRESLVVCGSSEALVPSVARRTLAGEERPSLCAAELTRPTRHLYLGVARQCSLGGGASREFENKHSGPPRTIESEVDALQGPTVRARVPVGQRTSSHSSRALDGS